MRLRSLMEHWERSEFFYERRGDERRGFEVGVYKK